MPTPRAAHWFFAAFAAFFLIAPLPALADEVIKDFAVTATLSADRNVEIVEAITYDFGDADRHGIYRQIPVISSRDGASYHLRLTVEDVTRDGEDEPFETTASGSIINIKIGDADKTITGPHAYRIRYRTDRAVTFFSDHSEFYWNVTGNGWEVPIEKSSLVFMIPATASVASVSSTCYTGAFGSSEKECTIAKTASGFTVTTNRLLLAEEGMTAAFAFPPGVIAEPTNFERAWQFLRDNAILLFPIIAFFVMGLMWWKKGRDPQKRTVVPEYEAPRKLSAALVGAAATENGAPSEAVTATIIDLARRGYLKIRFGEERKLFGTVPTFTFVKQREADDATKPYEDDILKGLFIGGNERTLNDLKEDRFYQYVVKFKANVGEEISAMKVFSANPSLVRGAYLVVAFITAWLLIVLFQSNGLETASAIATGVIIAGFGWFMPQRTIDGAKLLAEIQGFKWFLSVTEKDRLAFTDAPERTPEQFQAFLPYAIVFGVEKKWASQFASMQIPPPNWAEGNMNGMSAAVFASNLSNMHHAAASSAFATPSSGGSGFGGGSSGGGGGGGGGGSW